MDDVVQGTDAWLALRAGRVTASRVADVVAKTKSGYSASRAAYMGELIAERLTGVSAGSYMNAAMQWGVDMEPHARAAYAAQTFDDVKQIGFVHHPRIDMAGCSPDALVGSDGVAEFKCPATHTHVDTLLTQKVPDKYIVQIQWQLACCERAWADYVSFDPRLSEEMRLFVKRVERDDERIEELEREVTAFLSELDGKVCALQKLYGAKNADAS